LVWASTVDRSLLQVRNATNLAAFVCSAPSQSTFLALIPFVGAGGGNAGPCSDNVGTLMYTEIMDHVDSSGSFSVIDRDAAVVMLTFGGYVGP
jgi:hypothetical protein